MVVCHAQGGEVGFRASRGCSLAPVPFFLFFSVLALMTLLLSVVWFHFGAWPVVPFAVLEVGVLLAVLIAYARHAGDYERVSLDGGQLLVEFGIGGQVERHVFNPYWVRYERGKHDTLVLCSGGKTFEIGRYLTGDERHQRSVELESALRRLR